MNLKSLLSALTLSIAASVAFSQTAPVALQYSGVKAIRVLLPSGQLFVESVPGAEKVEVRVSAGSQGAALSGTMEEGTLVLTSNSEGAADLEVYLRGPARPLEAFLRHSQLTLLGWSSPVAVSGQNLELSSRGTSGALRVQTHSGGLKIAGHKGPVEIDTYKAKVELQQILGDVQITNFSGSTHVASLVGGLALDSYSGQVQVVDSEGAVHLRGARAPIQLVQHKGRVEGKINEGALVVELAESEPSIRVESTTGTLQVRMPASTGAQVYVSSQEGSLAVPRSVTTQKTAQGRVGWGRIQGSSGGRIHLRSQSGDIRIR